MRYATSHWLHLFYFSPGCVFTASDMLQDKHPVSCLITGQHRCLCPQNLPPCLPISFCSLRYFLGLRYSLWQAWWTLLDGCLTIVTREQNLFVLITFRDVLLLRLSVGLLSSVGLTSSCSPRPCCDVFFIVVVMSPYRREVCLVVVVMSSRFLSLLTSRYIVLL